MNRETNTMLGLAAGIVGLIALSSRRASASAPARRVVKPAAKPATKKPVRGVVTMGEPMMIKNGKRVPLSDRTYKPTNSKGPTDATPQFTDDGRIKLKPGMSDAELIEIGHGMKDGKYGSREVDMSALSNDDVAKIEEANHMDDAQSAAAMRRAKRAASLAAKQQPRDQDDGFAEHPGAGERLPTTLSVPPIDATPDSPTYYDVQDGVPVESTRSSTSSSTDGERGMPGDDDAPQPVNFARARKNASTVATMIKVKKRKYDHDQLRGFQRDAGMVPDGLYGPVSQGALRYYGVKNPPAPLYRSSSEITTYFPPPGAGS